MLPEEASEIIEADAKVVTKVELQNKYGKAFNVICKSAGLNEKAHRVIKKYNSIYVEESEVHPSKAEYMAYPAV